MTMLDTLIIPSTKHGRKAFLYGRRVDLRPVPLHRKIRAIREMNGLTQSQFAERLGIPGERGQASVSRWEKPGGSVPENGTLAKIAELGGITLNELNPPQTLTRTTFLLLDLAQALEQRFGPDAITVMQGVVDDQRDWNPLEPLDYGIWEGFLLGLPRKAGAEDARRAAWDAIEKRVLVDQLEADAQPPEAPTSPPARSGEEEGREAGRRGGRAQ